MKKTLKKNQSHCSLYYKLCLQSDNLYFWGMQGQEQKKRCCKTILHKPQLSSWCLRVTLGPVLSAYVHSEEYTGDPKYLIKVCQGLNLQAFHPLCLSSHHLKLDWTQGGYTGLIFSPLLSSLIRRYILIRISGLSPFPHACKYLHIKLGVVCYTQFCFNEICKSHSSLWQLFVFLQ